MGNYVNESKMGVIIIKLVQIMALVATILLTGCSVNNAYDNNNFEHVEEGLEAYSKQDIVHYQGNIKLFSRNELGKVKHQGKVIVLDEKFMEEPWTHGVLNYPLLILNYGETKIVDLESQTEIVSSEELRKHLKGSLEELLADQDLRFGDFPISHTDFNKITAAQYCPNKERIALVVESEYRTGSAYSAVGVYNVKDGQMEFTNISPGCYLPLGYGGDVGPFWSPKGKEFVYTLSDSGDSAKYMYVDSPKGNKVKLDGEFLQKHMELQGKTLYFPNFKEIKWVVEDNFLLFTTRAHDNSGEFISWKLDTNTGKIQLIN